MILEFEGNKPQIAEGVFLGAGCQIIGEVSIKKGASIWYNTVLRGDLNSIFIGQNTNIQENSSLHVDTDAPIRIGDNITVGHGAIVHGCEIRDNCLIGMGARILNHAVIKKNTIIGAGTVITPETTIPEKSLVLGVPGKVIRSLKQEEIRDIQQSAEHYVELAVRHRELS